MQPEEPWDIEFLLLQRQKYYEHGLEDGQKLAQRWKALSRPSASSLSPQAYIDALSLGFAQELGLTKAQENRLRELRQRQDRQAFPRDGRAHGPDRSK